MSCGSFRGSRTLGQGLYNYIKKDILWKVSGQYEKRVPWAKALLKLPFKIQRVYRQLVSDLAMEGPSPFGWDCANLKGRKGEIRIRLNREYRVILPVKARELVVIKLAHRKEAYE